MTWTPQENTRVAGIETNISKNTASAQEAKAIAIGYDPESFAKYITNSFVRYGFDISAVASSMDISVSKGSDEENTSFVLGKFITLPDTVSVATLDVNPESNARIDLITLAKAGGIVVTKGIPSGSPVAPDTPENHLVLYEITVQASSTTLDAATFTNKRDYIAVVHALPAEGYYIGQIIYFFLFSCASLHS